MIPQCVCLHPSAKTIHTITVMFLLKQSLVYTKEAIATENLQILTHTLKQQDTKTIMR